VGSEDGFSDEEHLAGKAKATREIRDDLYLVVFSVRIEELELPVAIGWQAVLAMSRRPPEVAI
jgi:hypothetical protein